MIDFIKLEVKKMDPSILKNNELLEFKTVVNTKTGELYQYEFAVYKNLKFKIFYPTNAYPNGRITIEGSLHKLWNNGEHNYNIFTVRDIKKVILFLRDTFGIIAENCILKQLELGVNIIPPIQIESILKNSLLHKTEPFKWIYVADEGDYIQVKHQRHSIKIYDKSKHSKSKGYKISKEILRFEIHFNKMIYFNKLGIYNLAELINYGLINFVELLVNEWNSILYYDHLLLDGTNLEDKYSNPNFWSKLTSSNFQYHRKKLNQILNNIPHNIKNKIEQQIREMAVYITTETIKINPLYISLNKTSNVKLGSTNNLVLFPNYYHQETAIIIPKSNENKATVIIRNNERAYFVKYKTQKLIFFNPDNF